MPGTSSPFETRFLPQCSPGWGTRRSNPPGRPARPATKVAKLLARLEQGPATAHELAMLVDVDSTFHVAGLLKYHRNIGRVTLERGRYALNEQFTDPAIWRAAELLRAAGWKVEAP